MQLRGRYTYELLQEEPVLCKWYSGSPMPDISEEVYITNLGFISSPAILESLTTRGAKIDKDCLWGRLIELNKDVKDKFDKWFVLSMHEVDMFYPELKRLLENHDKSIPIWTCDYDDMFMKPGAVRIDQGFPDKDVVPEDTMGYVFFCKRVVG